jgi:hypothetical protein
MMYKPQLLLSALLLLTNQAQSAILLPSATCGEKAAQVCYGKPDGTAQNVNLDDLAYVAAYLRYYGQSTDPPQALTIPATSPFECAEWSLYVSGTVMALAKHINPKVNSTVLFEDIANTIDGGETATDAQKKASLTGCGQNGGSVGVLVNKANPYYATDAFKKSGATTDGLIIKIVKAPA